MDRYRQIDDRETEIFMFQYVGIKDHYYFSREHFTYFPYKMAEIISTLFIFFFIKRKYLEKYKYVWIIFRASLH